MGKVQKVIVVLLLLAAVVLAVYAWVLSKEITTAKPTMMEQVVVAARQIPAGSQLSEQNLQLLEFPARPAGSYNNIDELAGRTTPVEIAAGEPLLMERLEASKQPSPQILAEGERAVAIKVDEVIAVGNRLTPGDRVDVFATFRRSSEEIDDSQARLLLSNLRVIAFGPDKKPEAKTPSRSTAAEKPRTAVLAVPFADIDKLALAAEVGHLLLALRPLEAEADPYLAKDESEIAEQAVTGRQQATTAQTVAQLAAQQAAQQAVPEQVISLRDLTKTASSKKPAAKDISDKSAPAAVRVPKVNVQVMHGLKAKTESFSLKGNRAGQ